MSAGVNWLSAIGILLDIVGAIWIAKALAFSADRALLDLAATWYGLSPTVLRSLEHQRLDARCGLGVLASGFLMQFVGALFTEVPAWLAGAIAVGALATVLVYYCRVKRQEEVSRATRVTEYSMRTGHTPE